MTLLSETTLLPSRAAHEFQPSKPKLDQTRLDDIFDFAWRRDSFVHSHPRERLQILLALLLMFHLGLHPIFALSEGFLYKDTTLIACDYSGSLRVFLIICLRDRQKNKRSACRWAG
jgi:hypothetical protein